MSLPRSQNDWIGLELSNGRYRIESKLGEGGMGFVYRVRDSNIDTDVVVKVPRRAMLEDPEFAPRFAREVRSLVRLAHPNIVRITDFGDHDGLPFAVMQYLSGGSLEDRRSMDASGRAVPCDPHEILSWLIPVAAALDFVHTQGYVHRDVKPGNILFDAQGNVFLSDFGVAKVLATTESHAEHHRSLTGTGMVLGTPDYMAPELIMGLEIDGGIDQYALAIMVYELLCGRTPFEGATGTAILVRHANEAPPRMDGLRSRGAEAISCVVMKALAKSRADRFPNCVKFATALETAIRDGRSAESTPDVGTVGPLIKERILCPCCDKPLRMPSGTLLNPERLQGRKVTCPACQAPLQFSEGGRSLVAVAAGPQASPTPSTGTRRFVAPEPGLTGSYSILTDASEPGQTKRLTQADIIAPNQESPVRATVPVRAIESRTKRIETRRYLWVAGIAASFLIIVGSVVAFFGQGRKEDAGQRPASVQDNAISVIPTNQLGPATSFASSSSLQTPLQAKPSDMAGTGNSFPIRTQSVAADLPGVPSTVPPEIGISDASKPERVPFDQSKSRPTLTATVVPRATTVLGPNPELPLSAKLPSSASPGGETEMKVGTNDSVEGKDEVAGTIKKDGDTASVSLDEVLADPKKFVGQTLTPAGLLSVDNVLQMRPDGRDYIGVISLKSKRTYPNPETATNLVLDPGVSQNLRGLIREGKIAGTTNSSLAFSRNKAVAYPVILTLRVEKQPYTRGESYVALVTEMQYLYWMNFERIANRLYENTFRCLKVTSTNSGFISGDGQDWKNRLGMKFLTSIKHVYNSEVNRRINEFGMQIDSQLGAAASRMSAEFQGQQSAMMRRVWAGR
jgi:serine/threonine protein kinase